MEIHGLGGEEYNIILFYKLGNVTFNNHQSLSCWTIYNVKELNKSVGIT